jgi:hypothetical protein
MTDPAPDIREKPGKVGSAGASPLKTSDKEGFAAHIRTNPGDRGDHVKAFGP